ncbi:MAG: DUF4390 domain-containing protein [Burkholderiales bacterium]|nr:MAG: DUF4390 domain-containing protein [Burkholderiales bacterium]
MSLAIAALVALFAGMPASGATDRIDVTRAMLEPTPDGSAWLLSAEFDIDLTERLEQAVERGVPVHFVLEFDLVRPRWYWTNRRITRTVVDFRLSYHALSRQYRLARLDDGNGYAQRFETLGEALSALARVSRWRVVEARLLEPDEAYRASLRLRIDVSKLPKPMQADAITNRDWSPRSEWSRFQFTPETLSSTR